MFVFVLFSFTNVCSYEVDYFRRDIFYFDVVPSTNHLQFVKYLSILIENLYIFPLILLSISCKNINRTWYLKTYKSLTKRISVTLSRSSASIDQGNARKCVHTPEQLFRCFVRQKVVVLTISVCFIFST